MKHLHKLIKDSIDSGLPTILYHASNFNTDELMPGFKHTGKLVEWDHGESNKFLYATTDKQTAIELGFASAIEKKFQLDRFVTKNDVIEIYVSETPINRSDLNELDVYLYTIAVNTNQGWVKNRNVSNNLDTEYKTSKTIIDFTKEKIDIRSYLKTKKIELSYKRNKDG